MRRIKTKRLRKQQRLSELEEIELLEEWIEDQKPDCGTNPLAIPPPPPSAPVGRAPDGCFSSYAGCKLFQHLPISRNTKQGLVPKYKEMSEIQRASLPHSLCGRDILGAAKTGSGKTLAFIIPVIEKLYRARWGLEDGVGSIIISPTKELAGQLFEELKSVGKYHSLSAGLLIGGRKDVDAEKERVNFLNILVCTPGRLLQHMNETLNFDCSQLQVLVLDEADRMLDRKFKGELDAIISQLPKRRQTLLFSATQTKSVKDLARLSLKDPELISVHAESVTATPEHLKQVAMEVPLDKKMNLLWSFIRSHLQSKMIVFLSTCKQVQFVYEAFKKLRPGIPLRCLHGNMKRSSRMAMYLDFCETTSVLFATDVASRGLDFPTVDWVIQVDCPEDVSAYIHRVGRTARYYSEGKSVLFLLPSEREMLIKLQSAKPKIPIQMRRVKSEKLEEISVSLASVLVKYPELQHKAKRAIITYVKSIDLYKDKEVFDVSKLPLKEYSASLGLPVIPKIRCRSQKKNGSKGAGEVVNQHIEMEVKDERFYNTDELKKDEIDDGNRKKPAVEMLQWNNKNEKAAEESEDEFLVPKRSPVKLDENGPTDLPTRILKKKKLKINVLRPVGNKVKYDEDGNQIYLPAFAIPESAARATDPEKAMASYYERVLEKMAQQDKEDKVLQRQGLREKRVKKKIKLKRSMEEEGDDGDDGKWESGEGEKDRAKSKKICFESDEDGEHDVRKSKKMKSFDADAISLAEQESLALKLLSSMHP